MSLFYQQMRATADDLLKEYGRTIVVRRLQSNQMTDPVAGTVTRAPALEGNFTAAILPASAGTLEAFDVRFMSEVQAGTDVRFCVMSAEGVLFQPAPGDEATFDGKKWLVMGCTPLNVDGTAVIFSVGFKSP